mmetsp:Transcript_19774/g.27838  ORF Transcript_19774/g.27838 Transcript_19774/m.27838 type:complete len:220 (-) Transcript_19774:229-888(-)|eukprot:CAMPEP_0185253034 /NCGR_PEP_ID=MMETSP1359-20130426/1940_1 /TAXON_ID=552665 /ORGANISM="Bigelowiella longifila, Strain CCMP242" /LENGTH=219 /DNA_ID=CAMNT_0027835339 /DNA_START=58 /DNA_END=717 /DNA_ORIENTATION=-
MSTSSPSFEDNGPKVSLCIPMQQMQRDISLRMSETESPRGPFMEANELKKSISKKLEMDPEDLSLFKLVPIGPKEVISASQDRFAISSRYQASNEALTAEKLENVLQENERLKATVANLSKSIVMIRRALVSQTQQRDVLLTTKHRRNETTNIPESAETNTRNKVVTGLEMELNQLEKVLSIDTASLLPLKEEKEVASSSINIKGANSRTDELEVEDFL